MKLSAAADPSSMSPWLHRSGVSRTLMGEFCESGYCSISDSLTGVSMTVGGEVVVSNLNVSGVRVSILRFLESVLGGDGCGGAVGCGGDDSGGGGGGGGCASSCSFGMEGLICIVRAVLSSLCLYACVLALL